MNFRSAVIALCAFIFVFGGCKRGSSSATGTEAARKVLRVGNGAEPQFIDPQVATGTIEYAITRALFEGLVNRGADGKSVIPGVAQTWDISDDKLTYTFHLRPDAKWSDGSPVTAEDFVESYQRMLTPTLAADYVYMMFWVAGAEDYYQGRIKDFSKTGFKAVDDHTLQIKLRQPAPFFLTSLVHHAWYPVPVKVVAKFGGLNRRDSDWTKPQNFVGNGPFRIVEWKPNQIFRVERSPTYWDRANVKLDEIDFYPVETTDTEERMFRTGQLDVTREVPLSRIPVYKREHPEDLHIDPLAGVYFYRFNIARKPLDDVRVRRALTLAINRESIIRNVLRGGEIPAYNLIPPGIAGFESTNRFTENVAEAKRLLAEAGYPDGKGFPHLDLLYNTMEKHREVAEAVQEMWKRNLGVEIGIYNEEWKVYLVSQKTINFSIQRSGWVADYLDPHVFLDLWRTGGGNNNTNWGSAEFDRLLDSALAAKDETERFATYNQMEKIFLDAMPVIPMFFYTQPRLINPRVKNYYGTLLDDYPWKFADVTP